MNAVVGYRIISPARVQSVFFQLIICNGAEKTFSFVILFEQARADLIPRYNAISVKAVGIVVFTVLKEHCSRAEGLPTVLYRVNFAVIFPVNKIACGHMVG